MSKRKETVEYWREKARVAEAELAKLREELQGKVDSTYITLNAENARLREVEKAYIIVQGEKVLLKAENAKLREERNTVMAAQTPLLVENARLRAHFPCPLSSSFEETTL